MKKLEIKAARIRLGLTQQQMADKLGIVCGSYQQKESGHIPFTEKQKFQVAKILGFDINQMNDYLFDGQLPLDAESNN